MAWECQSCRETNTFKEVVDTVLKVAVIGGIGYMAWTFRSQIKELTVAASAKAKKSLEGTPKKRRKK